MRTLVLVLLLALPAAVNAGEPPSYLILRAPVKPNHDPHATHGYYPGRGYGVETQTYNYGWFGAKPGRTWQRSTGYYRNYTQWSVR